MRSKAKPPTLVGARTGHRQGRSANATHQAQHSRTHESATKERDIKAPAREALKRRDTTSSGSEHVSSRAGRPRQNEITALALAGYRVIAPDLRGMGKTSSPYELAAYGREHVCADIVALMNSLYIQQATLVGRDLGGFIAWDLSLHYPERILAVINMTPFIPSFSTMNPLERLQANPGVYQYQLYFHKEGVPEKELERDFERTFVMLMRGANDHQKLKWSTYDVLERGGLFTGLPEKVEKSWILTNDVLKYLVEMYNKTGFRGPLNWYRTMEKDWKWNCKVSGRKVQQPSLMITVGRDVLIKPQFCVKMDEWIPRLDRAHIEEASHWVTLECPLELNRIMVDWLNKVHATQSYFSKL